MQDLDTRSARISRALLVTVSLCFATLLVSTIVLVGLSRTAVRTDEWIAATLEAKDILDELATTIADTHASQRGFLLTGDPQFLDAFRDGHELSRVQLEQVRKLTSASPEQQQHATVLGQLLEEQVALLDQTAELTRAGERRRVAQTVGSRGEPLMRAIRGEIEAMDLNEDQSLIDRRREAAVIREQFVAAVSGMVIVAGVFAVFALLSVRTYLRGLETSARRAVAYQAELEGRVQERTAELTQAMELAQHERARAETLLTDVNHRVGNNLALVSSFLTMQQRAVKNPEAARALAAARARVQAVASAHRKLRLGADFATVKAQEVLGAVLDDIAAGLPPDGRIRLDYDLQPIEIHARDAVSLGVLTSELVMNAIKHGFPGGRSGEVTVIFGLEAGGLPFLEVSDDGVGYEANNNTGTAADEASAVSATEGLGVRIIDMLARQFGGEVSRCASDDRSVTGTRVRVQLPRLELMHTA